MPGSSTSITAVTSGSSLPQALAASRTSKLVQVLPATVKRPRGAGSRFVVLSHASDEDGVRDFAARISTAVRELGLHHPRSTSAKFVTVSYEVAVAEASGETLGAADFLDRLLDGVPE